MHSGYDVVVIGAGPAGEVCAGRLAAGGLRVALAERELAGGECSYYGCIPSKTLLRPGHVLSTGRRVPGAAEAIDGGVHAAAALERRDSVVGGWDDTSQAKWLADNDVELVRGTGRLAGSRIIDVEAHDGSVTRLVASRAVVVATGTSAATPPVDGLRGIRAWDNRGATAAKEPPRRLIVLGGGAVGCEMAQAWRSLGAEEVTIVERADRLLAAEEPFAGEALAAAFGAQGIDVITSAAMTSVHRAGTDGLVTATLSDGRELTADELLVAVGRHPRTDDIGLGSIGLEPGGWIDTDDHLVATATAGGWLYAIGDVNGRALFTHMAKYQARVAADHILGDKAARDEASSAVPRVTFTDPTVAAVGLTASAALDRGIDFMVIRRDLADVAGAAVNGIGISGVAQLVIDRTSETIVGATFTGPDTGELLHAATIAIIGRVPMARLAHAVPAFPTQSEVWLRLLETYEEETR